MADIDLNLSIPDPKKFRSALATARERGLIVTQSFEELGIASGSIAKERMQALRRIDGIASVELDGAVSVPKPVR